MDSSDALVREFLHLIRRLRIEQNLTHEQLADLAGIDRSTVGLLERELRSPTLQIASQIASALGISLSEMVRIAEIVSRGEASEAVFVERTRSRKVKHEHLRNEKVFIELTGLDAGALVDAIESCYATLDIIDDQLSSSSEALSKLVELANLSSMVGNLLAAGLAQASGGLYKRNRPHAYPDLVPQKPDGVELEIKVALEKNSPKGHLPKKGTYVCFRYVLGDKEGHYQRAKQNRGNTVWIWEVKVGRIGTQDFALSSTEGDSGKTAVIRTSVFNRMPLVYYVPEFLPYAASKDGGYPGLPGLPDHPLP